MPKKQKETQTTFIKTVLIPIVLITVVAAAVWFWVIPAREVTAPPKPPQASSAVNKQAPTSKTPPIAMTGPGSPKPKAAPTTAEQELAVKRPVQNTQVAALKSPLPSETARKPSPESISGSQKESGPTKTPEKTVSENASAELPGTTTKTEKKHSPSVLAKATKRLKLSIEDFFRKKAPEKAAPLNASAELLHKTPKTEKKRSPRVLAKAPKRFKIGPRDDIGQKASEKAAPLNASAELPGATPKSEKKSASTVLAQATVDGKTVALAGAPEPLKTPPSQAQPTPTDEKTPAPREKPQKVRLRVKHAPLIDYNKLDQDQRLKALIDERKKKFGIEKSIDLIVKSDESLKVGDITVPMQEILDKIQLKEGDIVEKDLSQDSRTVALKTVTPKMVVLKKVQPAKAGVSHNNAPMPEGSVPKKEIIPHAVAATLPQQIQAPPPKTTQKEISGEGKAATRKVASAPAENPTQTESAVKPHASKPASILTETAFGIHVVRAGENVWNLHFQILRDYFNRRSLPVSIEADEPVSNGTSSGIGKLLKFSENLVYIYNLKERRLTVDLGMIHPLEKIVIYNMRRVFELLDQVDFTVIDQIEFDGEVIWIPTG